MRFGQGAQRGHGGPSAGRPESHAGAAGRFAAWGNRPRVCRIWACRGGGSKPVRRRGSARRSSTAPPARSRNSWKTAGRWTKASCAPSAPRMPRKPPGPRSWCSSARLPSGAPAFALSRSGGMHPLCPMVLDFRGEGLLSVLDLKPYVVKPNREELGQTFGRSLDDDADLLAAMRRVESARGAMGGRDARGRKPFGSVPSEHAYRLAPPRIAEVVNPIGCGDSLAAGIAWATRRGDSIVDAVRLESAPQAIIFGSCCPAGWSGVTWRTWRAKWRFSEIGQIR